MKEVELYAPVKELLTGLGYEVRAEVKDMDVIGMKDSSFIAVELKTSLTLKLLLQATQRQKLAEKVYVAIPAPGGRQRWSKAYKETEHLLRRLELGLILVHFKETPYAELVFEPKACDRNTYLARNKKKRIAALLEAAGRHGDGNTGGTNGKLMTVYREKALLAACFLADKGELSGKQLRGLTRNENIQAMLRNNHYGWFSKARHGVYTLTEAGAMALEEYAEVAGILKEELDNTVEAEG